MLMASAVMENNDTEAANRTYGIDIFGSNDDRFMAAQVQLSTKLPTLALEDIDHHLDYTSCSENSVRLGFATTSAKEATLREFKSNQEFYLITMHNTCNEDGERNVYLVTAVSSGNEDLDLRLSASPARWKDSIQTVKIDFGKAKEDYIIPGRGRVQKRQATSASEAVVVASTGAASSTIPVSFPAPPSSSPTAKNAHKDLGFSWIDTPLLPPSFPGVDSITLNAPAVPHGVTVSCKNCTVTGTIDILQASISGNTTSPASSNDDDGFSWDEGSFTFEANGFFAHIELAATVQPSAQLLTFNAPMPSIGIPGFSIPKIGAVGPVFKPAITMGTQISSELDFGYGFNLTVPNNSSIILDLGDPTNSKYNGFPNSQIHPLPFTASLASIALTISTSFHPELLLGISVLKGTLGAGVFFNLPSVSATVSQVAHVNGKCESLPPSSNNNNNTSSTTVLEDVFGNLTHIEANVEFDVGVLAEVEVGKLGAEDVYTVFNTSYAGPTACLMFDEGAKTLGAVTTRSASPSSATKGEG
ncbi:MAG: hypothetical protein LQ338_004675, partial [Usnochroma carphineum]